MILWKDFKVIPSKYFLHILTEWNVRPLEIADSDSSHSWSCCCCKVALGWWRASDRPVASCAIIWLALLACPRESPSPAPPLSALLCYQVHPQWEKVIVGLWEWEDKSPLSSNVSPGPFVSHWLLAASGSVFCWSINHCMMRGNRAQYTIVLLVISPHTAASYYVCIGDGIIRSKMINSR